MTKSRRQGDRGGDRGRERMAGREVGRGVRGQPQEPCTCFDIAPFARACTLRWGRHSSAARRTVIRPGPPASCRWSPSRRRRCGAAASEPRHEVQHVFWPCFARARAALDGTRREYSSAGRCFQVTSGPTTAICDHCGAVACPCECPARDQSGPEGQTFFNSWTANVIAAQA